MAIAEKKKSGLRKNPIFPRKDWTDDDIRELISLWHTIPSISLIAIILKRAPSSIQTQASRSGLNKGSFLKLKTARKRWSKANDDQLRQLVNDYRRRKQGIPIIDVARECDRSIDSTASRMVTIFDDKYIYQEFTVPETLIEVERAFKALAEEEELEAEDKNENAVRRKCLSCGRMFVSPDRKRIWRCTVCKSGDHDLGENEYVV